MAVVFPKNPRFHRLSMRTSDYSEWQEGCAHDPSLLEWEGKYYAYSTDTFGAPSGYQIRVSDDLLHWKYLGTAFQIGNSAKERAAAGLEEAFDWCVCDGRDRVGACTRKDGAMSFWAPHCVRGTDGKFWLYFCLTSYFGGSKSCIGIAKSDRPDGGFVAEQILVQSPEGWRTPNAIDPQVLFAENRMFLVYGSYGLGIYLIELDPATGLRKQKISYADFARKKVSFDAYYGVQIAEGSLEGGVLSYEKDVPVLENGEWKKKSYYYFMCSFGSLSSTYNLRCGRSERPEGPYTDVNGNRLVCSTEIGTGNKLLGSFRYEGGVDRYCPGHNDLFRSGRGVRLASYHCRTNYFIETGRSNSSNFHYLFLGQYAFNSDGWLVMNSNRYAGEELQPVSADELLQISDGNFEAVLFTQSVKTVESVRVRLHADGTLDGAYRGSWKLFGGNYISITADGEEYGGVVMPSWIETASAAGFTVTALGRTSGMALHLNSTKKI